MKTSTHGQQGFTLIEVVVTIIIAALAMAAVLPFLGNVFQRSFEPRAQLRDLLDLQSAIEQLVAVHTNSLETLRVRIGPEGTQHEGQFRVVENRFVAFTGLVEGGSPAANDLLKVTLENQLGERVTRLFADP